MTDPIPVSRILRTKAKRLLCWPHYDYGAASKVRGEMAAMGVESIQLEGPHTVDLMPVLGKGHTAVVVKASLGGEWVALKVRRMDAKRPSMLGEARLLGAANRVGVGPRLIAVSENLLAMELIRGVTLRDWLEASSSGDAGEVKRVLRLFFCDAFRLDVAGVDHGELIRLRRHTVLSGGRPVIIDFESASTARRASNLTTVIQSLFLNEGMRETMAGLLPVPDRGGLMAALKRYKDEPGEEGYGALLGVLGLG